MQRKSPLLWFASLLYHKTPPYTSPLIATLEQEKQLKYIKFIFILTIFSYCNLASSWDGAIYGTISRIDVAPGENYGIRIYLKDFPKLCGNDSNWAYLNESDSNYKTFVSVLLAAHMSQKNVTLYSNQKNGYCQIGYVVVQ
jgi:hypothetical protein